jgi:hypothetical protein
MLWRHCTLSPLYLSFFCCNTAVLQAINAVKYNPVADQPMDLSSNSSSTAQQHSARRQQAAAETAAAYKRFLDAAPDVHRHKPAALYYLAYIPLNENINTVAGEPQMSAEDAINRCQALYDMARAAEAQLPEEWLPVNCAVKDKIPMYLEIRRRTASWSRSARGGSSSNGSGRSSAAACASRAAEGCSSSHSRDSSSSRQEGAQEGEGAGSSKSKGKGRRSSSKGCCAGCGARDVKLRKCSGCKQVIYCNRECQTAHWKEHKKVCSSRQ